MGWCWGSSFLPNPSPLSTAPGGQRGLNKPVVIFWGEAASRALPAPDATRGTSPNPVGENPLALGGNSIGLKTWGNLPKWCREFGLALEQQYPEPFTFQGAAIQTERLWPNSSCHPFGVIRTGEDCQLLHLPHHQTMYPAGKLFLTCLLLFDLRQDQDPCFIPGQFSSLSPIPRLFPSPVSVTPGWS